MVGTGDTVLHKPTGEQWIVACVVGDKLSWCGWPEGFAELSDCELIEKAGANKKYELLLEMAMMRGNDHRRRFAIEALNDFSDKLLEDACGSKKSGLCGE